MFWSVGCVITGGKLGGGCFCFRPAALASGRRNEKPLSDSEFLGPQGRVGLQELVETDVEVFLAAGVKDGRETIAGLNNVLKTSLG